MPICASCGNNISDSNAVFCPHCGAKLPPVASPPAPPPGPPLPGGTVTPTTSGLALASLICGMLFFIFPSAIAAIIFGHISRSDIRRSGGRKTGSGMALAGLVLGYLGISIIPILIIAAIAIPNLMRAKIQANEGSAVFSLRALNESVLVYSNSYGKLPEALLNLGPMASGSSPSADQADLIDRVLARGVKSGYVFHYEITASGSGEPPKYFITADPVSPGATGLRHFFIDQTGVIRISSGGPATVDSPPLIGTQ